MAPSERNGAAEPAATAAAPAALLETIGVMVVRQVAWVRGGRVGRPFNITAEVSMSDADNRPREAVTPAGLLEEAWEAIDAKIEELQRAG